MLKDYRKRGSSWATYERQFLDLMKTRKIEEKIPKGVFDRACLLCSEDRPHHCHRRLVVEYLSETWGNLEVKHL
jgi:hypothetical protein